MNSLTLSELEQSSGDKCLIGLNGNVVDVTLFRENHPGGGAILNQHRGKDATDDFWEIGHSDKAMALMEGMIVAKLRGGKSFPTGGTSATGPTDKTWLERLQNTSTTKKIALLAILVGIVIGIKKKLSSQ